MTTIAWDGTTLAADRLSTCGDRREVGGVTKIIRTGDGRLLGGSGHFAPVRRAMRAMAADPSHEPSMPEGSRLLEVRPDGEARLHEAQGWFEVTPPVAMGSGSDFALAAMACGRDSVGAVAIAARFDLHTGGGVDVLRLDDA